MCCESVAFLQTSLLKCNHKSVFLAPKKIIKKKGNKNAKPRGKLDFPKISGIYMCPKCTKSYKLKYSLLRHLRFECGKSPSYPCDKCDKRFKHKYDMTYHMKNVHGKQKVKTAVGPIQQNNSILIDITNEDDATDANANETV